METETIDRLFLELSQFTRATTGKELALAKQLAEAKVENERLREVLFGEGTLEMLLAGKKSLFSCSEDPQLEDARSCFQAMVDAAFPKKEEA